MVQSEEIFQTIPEWEQVKDTREKGRELRNVDLKTSMKILFHDSPTLPLISS